VWERYRAMKKKTREKTEKGGFFGHKRRPGNNFGKDTKEVNHRDIGKKKAQWRKRTQKF